MIAAGSIVRGNWSQISYRVDHSWSVGDEYWCINGKAVDNPRWSGSFSDLGKIVGNEILINDPKRPNDRLIIVKEKSSAALQRKDLGKRNNKQMEFDYELEG